MIPSAFVSLDALPMTPSGKVDRLALSRMPVSDESLAAGAGSLRKIVPPRTPLEKEVALIWADLLGITWSDEQPPISVHDNFFEMGGHSLLATRIVSRLRETYQVDLPLRRMFETPTIAGIAEIITDSLIQEEMRTDQEELDALLAELEGMTDQEVSQMLSGESPEEG
jgi:acyl carrier protein